MLSVHCPLRVLAVAAMLVAAGTLTTPRRTSGQTDTLPRPSAAPSDTVPSPRPLIVGERLEYDVRFGPIKVGRASMEVMGIEEVRGRRTWHTRFQVTGGTLFFHVNDVLESWIDMETFSSLRFRQQLSEGSRDRLYEYEIYPERQAYVEKGKDERPSVVRPLDDASFLYFLRTVSLEVGATYEFERYFMPDRNPVRIDVTGRDTIDVPAGRFDALDHPPGDQGEGCLLEGWPRADLDLQRRRSPAAADDVAPQDRLDQPALEEAIHSRSRLASLRRVG